MKVPSLTSDSLHIWHIPLDPKNVGTYATREILGAEEKIRANRFRSDEAQDANIAARCAVRHILGSYLKITPGQLQLSVNEYNKPRLAPGCYRDDIQFNISHCADKALLAVNLGKAVGIDLERLDIERRIIPIARRYFTEKMVKAISGLSGIEQRCAFLKAWTQYEAYKKAQGKGLRGGDHKLDFNIATQQPDTFFPLFSPPPEADWLVSMLKLEEDWIGAVVLENARPHPQLSYFSYPDLHEVM